MPNKRQRDLMYHSRKQLLHRKPIVNPNKGQMYLSKHLLIKSWYSLTLFLSKNNMVAAVGPWLLCLFLDYYDWDGWNIKGIPKLKTNFWPLKPVNI